MFDMMRFIGFDREDEAEKWAKEMIGTPDVTGFCRVMSAVDENDEFVCAVVFTNFSSRNVDVNVVLKPKGFDSPKEFLVLFNGVFSYIFGQLKAVRATGLIRGKNIASKNFVEHLGFKLEGVMRKSFEDDDLHVYGFLAEEYNTHTWYRGKL
jgi:hypothetical protein